MRVPKVFLTVLALIIVLGLVIAQLALMQWVDTAIFNILHIVLFLVSNSHSPNTLY